MSTAAARAMYRRGERRMNARRRADRSVDEIRTSFAEAVEKHAEILQLLEIEHRAQLASECVRAHREAEEAVAEEMTRLKIENRRLREALQRQVSAYIVTHLPGGTN